MPEGDIATRSAFLASRPRPATVLAAWDGRAADVIHAADRARLVILDDVAVLGVDNDELICEHTTPPPSSVKTGTFERREGQRLRFLALPYN